VAWLSRVVNVPVRRSSLEAGAAEDVYRWRIDLSGSLVEGVAVRRGGVVEVTVLVVSARVDKKLVWQRMGLDGGSVTGDG
jgi:hypothetical protein